MIIVQPKSGAMAEASVGGQKFDFTAKENATTREAEGMHTSPTKDRGGVKAEVDVDVDKK